MRKEEFRLTHLRGTALLKKKEGGEAFILPRLTLIYLPVAGYFATVGMILGTPRSSCFACLLEDVDPSNGRMR